MGLFSRSQQRVDQLDAAITRERGALRSAKPAAKSHFQDSIAALQKQRSAAAADAATAAAGIEEARAAFIASQSRGR